MKKFLSLNALALALAIALGLTACGDKKVDADGWKDAFDKTLAAECFTVKEALVMEGDGVNVEAKFDKKGGKIWAKSSYGSGDDMETAEAYWVKTADGTDAYSKENGEWAKSSDGDEFNVLFGEWTPLGDNIKPMLEAVRDSFESAEFKDGKYTLPVTVDEEKLDAEVSVSGGYVKTFKLSSGKQKTSITLEFSDYGKTKMPDVPTVKPEEK